MQGIVDDGIGLCRRLDLVHFDRFTFQLFVVLEETPQHERAVRRHLLSLAVSVEFRVLRGDRDDLVVLFSGINHGHQTDGAGVDQGQRNHRLLA